MKKKLLTYLLMIALLLGMTGCGSDADSGIQPVEKAGTVILSVNPSVMIDYDTNGLVMDISGLNEDGLNLAAQEEDLLGVPCLIALNKLIVDINDAGFFVSDFGGHVTHVLPGVKDKASFLLPFVGLFKAVAECLHSGGDLFVFPFVQRIEFLQFFI